MTARLNNRPGMTSTDWLCLVLVTGIALVVRLVYFLEVHQAVWFVNPMVDSVNYHQWAQRISAGDFLGQGVFVHSPLYAYFLALIYLLAGPSVTVVVALQFVLGALCCGLFFLLARQLCSRPAGMVAGLLAAFYGPAIFFEGNLLTALLINLLNTLTIFAAYRAVQKGLAISWLLTGILLGLSVLTRPNVILFFPVLAGWIWLSGGRSRVIAGVALAAGLFLMIVPSVGRNLVVLDELMLSVNTGGINFYLGNARGASGYHRPLHGLGRSARGQAEEFREEASRRLQRQVTYSQSSRFWFLEACRHIGADPMGWLSLIARKALLFFNNYEYTTSLNYYLVRQQASFFKVPWLDFSLVFPLAMAGMILSRQRWRRLLPLYGLVVVYFFTNIAMLVSAEYRYAIMVAAFSFAGAGAVAIYEKLRQRAWRSLILPVVVFSLFFGVARLNMVDQKLRDYHLSVAYLNLGGTHNLMGDYQQAAAAYEQAMNLTEKGSKIWGWLVAKQGKMLMQKGEHEQALAVFLESYRANPFDLETINDLAKVLTLTGHHDRAIALREEAIRLNPAAGHLYVDLGIAYLAAGRNDEAERIFESVAKRYPGLAPEIALKRAGIIEARPHKKQE